MKISYEWLREYVNTKIRAENLRSILTMAGHEVFATEKNGKDFIFEMEVTPNRPDCLCHIGMARETSALTKKSLRLPKISLPPKRENRQAKVSIEDTAGCPRYSARIIADVRVSPSPKWLVKRVESMGLRPVNNIVDITNFVLFETGQPLHAFDLDKLTKESIVVRKAKSGEKMVTIEESEKELDPRILVIADQARPIAVAGVMGGKDTEVTEQTKNILLESAYFDPATVRKSALLLGLSTDSSYRFERGVDLAGVVTASDRAASLICDIAKGRLGNIVVSGQKNKKQNTITLRAEKTSRLLGVNITPQKMKEYLQRMGFKCKGGSVMEVLVPSFRDDVAREADLIEEVARVYGYENIPSKAPAIVSTDEDPQPKDIMRKCSITKGVLVSSGFNEIISHSLISRQTIERLGIPAEGAIEIRNPLSKEQEIMRQSLMPGMIKAVSYNISRQIQEIKIFELSNIYFIKEGAYNEELFLALAQYGRGPKTGREGYLSSGIFQLKTAITALGERLGTAKLEFERTTHPLFLPGQTLVVLSGGLMLGAAGKIKPGILEGFDIKGGLYAAELNFKTMVEVSNLNRSYRPLPRFPHSYRDISFAVDNKIFYREIAGLIKSTGGALVEDMDLLSEYRGEHIPKGRRGLAIRIIYRSKEKTLTEEEINRVDTLIRGNLAKTFSVTLR